MWEGKTIRDREDGMARPSETVRDGEAGTMRDFGRWLSETITDGETSDGEPSEIVKDGEAGAIRDRERW